MQPKGVLYLGTTMQVTCDPALNRKIAEAYKRQTMNLGPLTSDPISGYDPSAYIVDDLGILQENPMAATPPPLICVTTSTTSRRACPKRNAQILSEKAEYHSVLTDRQIEVAWREMEQGERRIEHYLSETRAVFERRDAELTPSPQYTGTRYLPANFFDCLK